MSDAGRKMDVEDVLSSIRRLVSEEARNAPDSRGPEKSTPAPTTPPREKLVLTPAFRIPEEPAEEETVAITPAAEEVPVEKSAEVFTLPTEPAPQSPASDEPVQTTEPPQDITPESVPRAENSNEAPLDLSAIVPSLQDLQKQADAQQEYLHPAPELTDDDVAPEPVAESPLEASGEIALDPVEESTDISPEPSLPPQAEAPAHNEVEPDPAPGAIAEHPTHSAEDDTIIDFTAEKETYLDEEALRELVSEMVRSELQGELGDRITRNVRKLVRREIHRALASREFE